MKQRDSLKKVLKLLKDKSVLIDADIITKMEAAEKGDINACHELVARFGSINKGYTKNYDASMYYMNIIKNAPENTANPEMMFSILSQDAFIETAFYRYDTAITKFEIALRYMVNNLSASSWDYKFLEIIPKIKYLQENQYKYYDGPEEPEAT